MRMVDVYHISWTIGDLSAEYCNDFTVRTEFCNDFWSLFTSVFIPVTQSSLAELNWPMQMNGSIVRHLLMREWPGFISAPSPVTRWLFGRKFRPATIPSSLTCDRCLVCKVTPLHFSPIVWRPFPTRLVKWQGGTIPSGQAKGHI